MYLDILCMISLIQYLAGKNGVYCDLVRTVHEAFKQNELVRIDCKGLPISDYKKIGAKLRVCYLKEIIHGLKK